MAKFFFEKGVQDFEFRRYDSLDQIINSDLIPQEDFKLENNWRGRILRYGKDFTWDINSVRFEEVFLKSYFRLILTYTGTEYFGRHDIAPVFYNPGHSTAGFQDYRGAVNGLVGFLNRGRAYEKSPADQDFDYIRIFISNGRNQKYEELKLDGVKEVGVVSLFDAIDEYGELETTNFLYRAIDENWRR